MRDSALETLVGLADSRVLVAFATLCGVLAGIEFLIRYTLLFGDIIRKSISISSIFTRRIVRRSLQVDLANIRFNRLYRQGYTTIKGPTMAPVGFCLILTSIAILLSFFNNKIDLNVYIFIFFEILVMPFYLFGRYKLWFRSFYKNDPYSARKYALSLLKKIDR